MSFLLFAAVAVGQTRIYEIRFSNNPIGTLEAKRESTATTRRITLKSRVQMKLLSRMDVDIYAEYKHNNLQESKAIRHQGKNGADDKETLTEKADKGYNITRKGESTKSLQQAITYSVADLYFEEPKDLKEIYSETLGVFLPIKQQADKRYELTLPEGRKNFFRYEKGKLVEVEVSSALGKAIFRFVQEK